MNKTFFVAILLAAINVDSVKADPCADFRMALVLHPAATQTLLERSKEGAKNVDELKAETDAVALTRHALDNATRAVRQVVQNEPAARTIDALSAAEVNVMHALQWTLEWGSDGREVGTLIQKLGNVFTQIEDAQHAALLAVCDSKGGTG